MALIDPYNDASPVSQPANFHVNHQLLKINVRRLEMFKWTRGTFIFFLWRVVSLYQSQTSSTREQIQKRILRNNLYTYLKTRAKKRNKTHEKNKNKIWKRTMFPGHWKKICREQIYIKASRSAGESSPWTRPGWVERDFRNGHNFWRFASKRCFGRLKITNDVNHLFIHSLNQSIDQLHVQLVKKIK